MLSITGALAVGLVVGCSTEQPNTLPRPTASIERPAADSVLTADDWPALEAAPYAYAGRRVSFVGKVFAPFDRSAATPNIQVFVVPLGAAAVAVIAVDQDPGVMLGDYVAVQGDVLGGFEGTGPFRGVEGVVPVWVAATSVEATTGPPSPPQ